MENMEVLDEVHVTTISPTRTDLIGLECSETDFKILWQQIQRAAELFPGKIFFRMYRIEYLAKFAGTVGKRDINAAFFDPANVRVGTARMEINVDNVSVSYFPLSIGINETFVIDADGFYRAPYSIGFTLSELAHGESREGLDITAYTIERITPESQFTALYGKGVRKWLNEFSTFQLEKEERVINTLRQ